MDIQKTDPPEDSLIAAYAQRAGHYTDCFEARVTTPVTLPQFICAFYTQPLFRAERLVLRLLARAPSSDAQVNALADGTGDSLAVWRVAARRENEIVMMQQGGRTCSWLQVAPDVVRFGSVVTPVQGRGGSLTLGPVFHSLKGAHEMYSRALLAGAVRRLR